jgi:predicted nucleic acid-binding protein
MRIADTNVLLGLILPDRPQHAAFADAAADADASAVLITEGVLAECVWVLCKQYDHTRPMAARVLLETLDGPGIAVWDRDLADRALRLMAADASLDIVDCLLLERAVSRGDEILSFDRRLCQRAQEYVKL